MSRNSSGTYSLPSGNPVVAGTTIAVAWANDTMTDLATAMTDSLSRSGKGGMSAQLVGIAGTAAAPAFTFTGDAATGVYLPTTSALGLAVAGVARMGIDYRGRVEIGGPATAPSASLELSKTITGPTFGFGIYNKGVIQSDVTSAASLFATNASTAAAAFTLADLYHFRVTEGTLGAGSAVTRQYGFYVGADMILAGANYGFYGNLASGTDVYNLYMNGSAWNYMQGVTLINSVSQRNGCHLSVVTPNTDNVAAFYITGDNGSARNVIWFGTTVDGASGAVTLNGLTVALVNVSDYRRKENVEALTDSADRLAKLRPVAFTWKDSSLPAQRGFLAHEFGEVYPQAVSGDKDAVDAEGNPVYQMMSDAAVIPDLVAATKQLLARVTRLEATA